MELEKKEFKENYAKWLLEQKKIKLFQGKDRVLEYGWVNYPIPYWKVYPKLDTYIIIGSYNEKEIKTMTYSELQKNGIYITQINAEDPNIIKRGQRKEFRFTKTQGSGTLDRIPEFHNIEHDVFNGRIRLVGSNSNALWYFIKPQQRDTGWGGSYLNSLMGKEKTERVSSWGGSMMSSLLNPVEKKIYVKELPILISKNLLVCIQEENDELSLGCFGLSGSGKSVFLMSLVGHGYWKWRRNIIILNDKDGQTLSHVLPCNYHFDSSGEGQINKDSYMARNLKKIGEEPRPLPIVPVYPSQNDINMDDAPLSRNNLNLRISLPFSELLNNMELFLKGDKDSELGKTGKYLAQHKQELMECKNEKQVLDKVKSIFVFDKEHKMLDKAMNRISIFLNEKMFDINTVDSELTVEFQNDFKLKFPILQALPLAGCIPSLQTGGLLKKNWRYIFYRYVLQKIFNDQQDNRYLRDNQIIYWLVMDDLEALIDKVNKKEITELFTTGRFRRVGKIYATQHFDLLPEQVTEQTYYALIYRTNNKKIVSLIGKTYDLDEDEMKQIRHLKTGAFEKGILPEVMLLGKKRKFVCYDLITGERTENEGPFVGKIINPLSLPKAPKMRGVEDEIQK